MSGAWHGPIYASARPPKYSATQTTKTTQALITKLEKSQALATDAIDKSTDKLSAAQDVQIAALAQSTELANSSLKAKLDAAIAQLQSDQAQLSRDEARLKAAKTDSYEIEQTVEQLGIATDAAIAAIAASEVAAATSAGKLIAQHEGGTSENPSLLARLTFNIFSETQTQVSGAERARKAASTTLATGESQLAEASDIEATIEAERDAARTTAANALVEKTRLQKLYKQLVLDRETAAKALKAANAAQVGADEDLAEKKSVEGLASGKLAEARNTLKSAIAKADVAAADIETAQAHFDVAQTKLSALRKKRALRSAVVLPRPIHCLPMSCAARLACPPPRIQPATVLHYLAKCCSNPVPPIWAPRARSSWIKWPQS
ncbi:hypothetical protein JI58_04195 [Marinosulfonomonas sp. PRT-SC04]|nr:hypothetical protein JI58_04195 [Marinosulfonomonas sp. PRT-SC04]